MGTNVIVIVDPKGSRDLLAQAAAAAHQAGKPFAFFSPAFPHVSASFDPLGSATTPLEVAARIEALMPASKEPFFRTFSLAFLISIAEAQQRLGQRWTLEGLYAPSVLRHHLETLLEEYLSSLGCYAPRATGKQAKDPLKPLIDSYRRQGLSDHTADALINDYYWPHDHYQKITGTLIPTFAGVTGGEVGALLSPPVPDLSWPTIVSQGMVVYLALASMMLGETANRIGRVIVQDLVGFLGRRYTYEDVRHSAPITVVIDEAGSVFYPGFIEALNKAGEANARFILAMQSLADAEAVMGPIHTRRLRDNLNTQVFFRLADMDTAEGVTQGLTTTTALPEQSLGIGYGDTGGLSGHATQRTPRQRGPLIRPDWLTGLPRGEAFARLAGGWWKLRTPLLTPVSRQMLDTVGLTALYAWMAPDFLTKGDVCDPGPAFLPAPPSRRRLPWPAAMLSAGKSTSSTSVSSSPATPRAKKSRRRWGRPRVRRAPVRDSNSSAMSTNKAR